MGRRTRGQGERVWILDRRVVLSRSFLLGVDTAVGMDGVLEASRSNHLDGVGFGCMWWTVLWRTHSGLDPRPPSWNRRSLT